MAKIIDFDGSVEQVNNKDYLQVMHLGIAKNHKWQKIQWGSVLILRTFPPINTCSIKAFI